MSLSYSQCLIFLGSREDEKMRPPSKPNPRRLLGHSLHDFSGTTYEEAKALRAFTRTATVFVAGIRINASLSVNPTYAVRSRGLVRGREGMGNLASREGSLLRERECVYVNFACLLYYVFMYLYKARVLHCASPN